jgi:hypothetical protein
MTTGQIMRQIRNVTAAAALATMTGCASYDGGYGYGMAYADPAYGWDEGYGVFLRDHWHNHLQDHFHARAMHGIPHGGLAMAHFGGSRGGFAGGHGRG